MINTSRTLASSYLQTCAAFGITPEVAAFSTLNEKFNVHKTEVLSPLDQPIIQYIAIGNGGHYASVTEGNRTSITGVPRSNAAAALYNHIPYVLRRQDNDLTAAERTNYRLRRIEEYGGVTHVAYYLKKFTIGSQKPETIIHTTDETTGVTTQIPYVPTISDLHPSAPTGTSSSLIVSSIKIPFTLTQDEIDEITAATTIMYGTGNGIISELGFVSGVDRVLTGNFNGTTGMYTEVVAAQLRSSINIGKLLDFGSGAGTTMIDVGTLDPLYTSI